MRYAATIEPIAPRCIVELRGDAAAAHRLAAALGIAPPPRPNTIARNDAGDCLAWLGPRRWLAMAPLEREIAWRAIVDRAVGAEPGLVGAVVSDMYAGFAVAGRECREVLAQGILLDLAPEAMPADLATGSDFHGVPVLLWQRPAGHGFELWFDRSLAGYAGDWLQAALGVAPASA